MKRLAVIAPLLLGAAALAAAIGSPLRAQSRQSWNGTWAGGWTAGTGAQIVFAGDDFTGARATVSEPGRPALSFELKRY